MHYKSQVVVDPGRKCCDAWARLSPRPIHVGGRTPRVRRGLLIMLGVVVLGLGAAAIWKYIADPLGLYLLSEETRQVLFFPSSTVVVATLVLLAFRDDDQITLDRILGRD